MGARSAATRRACSDGCEHGGILIAAGAAAAAGTVVGIMSNELFAAALGVASPWHVRDVRFDARCHRNRPGLLLLNGVVYAAYGTFSCDGDCPDGNRYRGWVS